MVGWTWGMFTRRILCPIIVKGKSAVSFTWCHYFGADSALDSRDMDYPGQNRAEKRGFRYVYLR